MLHEGPAVQPKPLLCLASDIGGVFQGKEFFADERCELCNHPAKWKELGSAVICTPDLSSNGAQQMIMARVVDVLTVEANVLSVRLLMTHSAVVLVKGPTCSWTRLKLSAKKYAPRKRPSRGWMHGRDRRRVHHICNFVLSRYVGCVKFQLATYGISSALQ